MKRLLSSALLLGVACAASAQGFVPFPIATSWPTTSPLNRAHVAIETTSPRLTAAGGHFVHGGQPVRILGVNTTFAGNFPTHEQAADIAGRLASAGVNCVRFHHMDTQRWPSGIWDSATGQAIEPQALERLDYFIDQLARHGIFSNINLHVGREHSQYLGLPDPLSGYDKVACIFTPALVDAQKLFAQQILSRVNTYRGVTYASDPAVAMVEITNENSFFMWDGEERVRQFPTYYADLLKQQYTAWLAVKYGTTATLAAAWTVGTEPLGASILVNGDFRTTNSSNAPTNWTMEQHSPAAATATVAAWKSRPCVRLQITNSDATDWHLQFKQVNLQLGGDRYYTITVGAAAETSRSLRCGVQMDHSPWSNLGLSRSLDIGPDWTTQTLGFTCNTTDTNARLSFAIGETAQTIYLADVQMRPGGQQGLIGSESLETTVALYADRESRQRAVDRMRFFAETERAYFTGMSNYVRNNLGCGAMITGTIVFGPLGAYAQSDMDFIDSHAYWKHPQFPGTPWDSVNWYIDQMAMTDNPSAATLHGLACERIAGRPFTVSEYNHPAPNDYQAECIPMLAAYAAAQDWDGIWLFDYGNRPTDPARQKFNSFFDSETNPSKWGFMRAAAAAFRGQGLPVLDDAVVVPLTGSGDVLTQLVGKHLVSSSMSTAVNTASGLAWRDLLGKRIEVALEGTPPPAAPTRPTAQRVIDWTSVSGTGFFAAQGAGAVCFSGHAADFATSTAGMLALTNPPFAAAMLTPLDGEPISSSCAVLLTGCGRCENTGMVFSADRRTVTNKWGTAPVQVQPLEGTLTLPRRAWTCQALSSAGMPTQTVPVTLGATSATVSLSAGHATMWYLLTAPPVSSAVKDFTRYE